MALISLLKAKIHHARVTSADLNYVGSITIDRAVMDQAGIYPFERVLVVDVENGARFETYTIVGEPGSGVIQVNGAAAHLVTQGDRLIIMAFALVEAPPPPGWCPVVLVLDETNRVTQVLSDEADILPPGG